MIIPVGSRFLTQQLLLVIKNEEGKVTTQTNSASTVRTTDWKTQIKIANVEKNILFLHSCELLRVSIRTEHTPILCSIDLGYYTCLRSFTHAFIRDHAMASLCLYGN